MGVFEMMQCDEADLDRFIQSAMTGREIIAELAERAERGEIVSTGNLAGSVIA